MVGASRWGGLGQTFASGSGAVWFSCSKLSLGPNEKHFVSGFWFFGFIFSFWLNREINISPLPHPHTQTFSRNGPTSEHLAGDSCSWPHIALALVPALWT